MWLCHIKMRTLKLKRAMKRSKVVFVVYIIILYVS